MTNGDSHGRTAQPDSDRPAAVAAEILKRLEPLSSLSADSMRELSRLCYAERVSRNLDPFRVQGLTGQAVYLVKGELKLEYPDASTEVIVGGTEAAARTLSRRKPPIASAKAITDIELIRIDEDVLDIMLTWDQVVLVHKDAAHATRDSGGAKDGDATDWRTMTGMFAAENLTRGAFATLPPAHIEVLFKRFERIKVVRGQLIIREGDEGDYYYLIESGRCVVTRQVGGVAMTLAELKAGDAFGEEALVASAKRNASVMMKTDGVLMRLAKGDFIELLQQPFMQVLTRAEAERKVAAGAVWLDVRFAAEYNLDKLPGAINIPLHEIRNLFGAFDKEREYIVYCQSGRRSSAATFLLSQRGYKAWLLDGGLRKDSVS